MSDVIAALDNALAQAGEDIILRRVIGTGANVTNIDVKCRARVDAMKTEQLVAGINATDLNVIISPTQINNEQWPGGTIQAIPPFNLDQRIPRVGPTDKILMRGQQPRAVAFSDPKFINGELVRIDMRVTG